LIYVTLDPIHVALDRAKPGLELVVVRTQAAQGIAKFSGFDLCVEGRRGLLAPERSHHGGQALRAGFTFGREDRKRERAASC
jgi:hypothetical protein